jgi:hypothetical protein
MDKYRKAVVYLCAAIELAEEGANSGQKVMIDPNHWRSITKLVASIKASMNHGEQYRYEQHIERERELRSASRPKEAAA